MTDAQDKQTVFRALLWLAVFGGLWGVIERLGMAIADTYHFAQIVGMRYIVHIAVLLVICRVFGSGVKFGTRRPVAHFGLGLCMWVMPASFIFGGSGQTGANLWSAFWFMPIFLLAVAPRVVRDRSDRGVWIAVIIAHVGALLVLGTDLARVSMTTLIPAIGGLSFAVYVVLLRLLRDQPVATNLFYTALIPLLGMMPLMIAFWQPIQTEDIWRIVAIGVTGLIILYSLDRAMHIVSPAFAAPLLYLAVVSEPLIEFLRSGHVPNAFQIIGFAILSAIGLTVVLKNTAKGVRHV